LRRSACVWRRWLKWNTNGGSCMRWPRRGRSSLKKLIKEALGPPTSPFRLRVATGLLLFLRKAKPDLRHQVKAGAGLVVRGCGCHFQTLFGKVPVLRRHVTQWRPQVLCYLAFKSNKCDFGTPPHGLRSVRCGLRTANSTVFGDRRRYRNKLTMYGRPAMSQVRYEFTAIVRLERNQSARPWQVSILGREI
jgi:hypothetical protein